MFHKSMLVYMAIIGTALSYHHFASNAQASEEVSSQELLQLSLEQLSDISLGTLSPSGGYNNTDTQERDK